MGAGTSGYSVSLDDLYPSIFTLVPQISYQISLINQNTSECSCYMGLIDCSVFFLDPTNNTYNYGDISNVPNSLNLYLPVPRPDQYLSAGYIPGLRVAYLHFRYTVTCVSPLGVTTHIMNYEIDIHL